MIIEYKTGTELYQDNVDFLNTNAYLSVFFKWDAPLLKEINQDNYAFKCVNEDKQLLVLKVEPFNILLFGDEECVEELFHYLITHGFGIGNYLCGCSVGNKAIEVLKKYDRNYDEVLAMDFMEATEITEPSCAEVDVANENDFEDISHNVERFIVDCGLADEPNPENIRAHIGEFRVIRKDGQVVCMAKRCLSTDKDAKISEVYTKDEYRGQGLARKVVNTLKNEIIQDGLIATLNVDKHNPITNHLYRAIGFKPLFSQGEYRPVKQNDLYSIIRITDIPEYVDVAAEWFHSKWHIPKEAYKECMELAIEGDPIQQWYLCLDHDKIIAGMGEIENDFHDRVDLTPNICAVYTEKDYRNQGIAGKMLDFVVEDNRKRGIIPVYLLTDHTSFYERYQWQFYCMVQPEDEPEQSRLYIHY